MRDKDNRGAKSLMQALKQSQDFLACLAIKVSGGFIRQQERRFRGECTSDSDALALAAGKLIGKVVQTVTKSDQIKKRMRALPHFGGSPASQMQWQPHILQASQAGKQIEELENETDLFATEAGDGIVI
jgi:acyl-CoA thioesterase-1